MTDETYIFSGLVIGGPKNGHTIDSCVPRVTYYEKPNNVSCSYNPNNEIEMDDYRYEYEYVRLFDVGFWVPYEYSENPISYIMTSLTDVYWAYADLTK